MGSGREDFCLFIGYNYFSRMGGRGDGNDRLLTAQLRHLSAVRVIIFAPGIRRQGVAKLGLFDGGVSDNKRTCILARKADGWI